MTGRIPFGLLSLLTALVCVPIQAQDQMGQPSGYGVQPAGFHALHEPEGAGQYHGIPLNFQRAPSGRTPGPRPTTVYEELPDDLGFAYEDTGFGKLLTQTLQHAWFRGEYILWNASAPGHVLLGEQPSNGIPLTQILGEPVNRPISQGLSFSRTVSGVTGNSIAPGLDDIAINNMNGFRGTFGLPVPTGQFELSSFVLGSSIDSFEGEGYIQPQIIANPAVLIGGTVGADGNPAINGQTAQFVTQPILINGLRQNLTANSPAIDYDISYKATLTTSTWGSEGNYVADSPDPNSIFQLRPTIGVRYFNFRDRLNQGGRYNEIDRIDPTITRIITRQINSSANNDLFGPQVGFRAEAVHSRFLIGVEPKLMFGINSWKSSLDTSNVFGSLDRAQEIFSRGTTFSPLFDIKLYTNVSLSKNVAAYVSYNYLWIGELNHSYNDVQYNQNTAGQSDFHLKRQYSNSVLQGLSFGFSFQF